MREEEFDVRAAESIVSWLFIKNGVDTKTKGRIVSVWCICNVLCTN